MTAENPKDPEAANFVAKKESPEPLPTRKENEEAIARLEAERNEELKLQKRAQPTERLMQLTRALELRKNIRKQLEAKRNLLNISSKVSRFFKPAFNMLNENKEWAEASRQLRVAVLGESLPDLKESLFSLRAVATEAAKTVPANSPLRGADKNSVYDDAKNGVELFLEFLSSTQEEGFLWKDLQDDFGVTKKSNN